MSKLTIIFGGALLLTTGCGVAQTNPNAKQEADLTNQLLAISKEVQKENAQCTAALQIPELDVIRGKVVLDRTSGDTPVPFEIASNDSFSTESEQAAIAKWGALRDACFKRIYAYLIVPASATALQAAFIQQLWSIAKDDSQTSQLIVLLYQQKLTYGEFGQRRHEMTRDTDYTVKQYRETESIADQQQQLKAQQSIQQDYQNRLNEWAAYIQTVSARQPKTIHLNSICMSQDVAGLAMTKCH